MFLDTIGNWWGFVAHQAHIKYVSVFTEIYSPFLVCEGSYQFQEDGEPLTNIPGPALTWRSAVF
jgi:hypothetical protein